MVKINFYLDKPNSRKKSCIMLSCHATNRIRISTGISIEPMYWNKKKQRVKDITATNKICRTVNRLLDGISESVNGAYLQSRLEKRQLTREDVISAIKPKEEIEFIPQYEKYIKSLVNIKKDRTIIKHITTLNSIKKFQERTGYKLTFDTINEDFFHSYVDYYVNHPDNLSEDKHIINLPEPKKGLFNNTIDSYLERLKIFMNYANSAGLTDNLNHKKFELTTDDPEVISLTFEELEAINNLDLPDGERLDNARSLFLLECYTSLRYSDIENLKPDHLKKDAIILDVTTIKTNCQLQIPISPPARKLVNAFKEGKIHQISNQKLNDYIKKLAQLAKINDPCLRIRHSGANRIEMLYKKWELITSHVGRKTFVTLHYLGGVPAETLMAITGHKDYRNFKKYLKIDEKAKAKAINDVWINYKPQLI